VPIVLELLLGLVGALAFAFGGSSEVVARAMVGAVVAAGGDAAVVFIKVKVAIVTEFWASVALSGVSGVAMIGPESMLECWAPMNAVAGAAAVREAWTWA
jgi:hypothetical protein